MTNIAVPNFPQGVRVPGVYVGIDPSNANTGTVNQNTLIIGQITSTATATAGVPFLATTATAVTAAVGGPRAQLSRMFQQYRTLDSFGSVWLLPLADNAAGVAGTTTVTITGATTTAGTLNLYIGGQLAQVASMVGDTPTMVATAIVTACTNDPNLPVLATSSAGVVTLTNVHKNSIAMDVRVNYQGAAAGEVTPAGLTVAIAAGVTPSGDPDLSGISASVGDTPFDFICTPYSNPTQAASVEALLNDQTGRWSWQSEIFGMAFGAVIGTHTAITTFGGTNNNQHISFLGVSGSPTPQDEIAALYCATCANSLRSSAALPLTQIPLGFLPPPPASRFIVSERQLLLYSGISTFIVDQSNTAYLERACTTSQTIAGAASNAYLDVETMATLMAVIRQVRSALQSKFARAILVADGTRITAGSNMVTSQTVLGEVIAQYAQLAQAGLVQSVAAFAQAAYATNSGGGQVTVYCPFNLANQLRVIGLAVQFQKT